MARYNGGAIVMAVVVAVVALVGVARAAECHGSPKPDAQPNLNAIYDSAPVLVRQVANAKLYRVGGGNDTINVVHLWGTPYEKGFAHGTLMQDDAKDFINAVWAYLELQVEQALNGSIHTLKPGFIEMVANYGLEVALDLTLDLTRPFTGQYFFEEMKGMADATGLSYSRIEYIHMIGELTQGDCSISTRYDMPFLPAPPHFSRRYSVPLCFFVFLPLFYFFPLSLSLSLSRFPCPLHQRATIEDARQRIADAPRTCNLILGVGDGKSSEFNGIEYSYSVARFFTDTDNEPVADWHPRINDIVYYGMDWLCPGYNQVLGEQLQKHHGNITAENTIRDITAITQTGDLHIAIYDLEHQILHTANARRDSADGPNYAYQRPFVKLDMKALFEVTL
ncbi:uncharacterized protein MONBRDRAFT_32718 [Monosiga brevicollis MX1]|uniref:Uncharacterized protein n=1 Tax=Monosiga brevicollis TaxID=81824 RepID=A9V198_MONBE|nr:uncharacterized protein MONBRDRAFT_32718 [Monosiga brevicollis MX1]EDQ88770.1 predicted protein [Monosiga brevicollis MX1]|eukprot:XP_001746383.1 hypothetical protein [Monosiga brevicollis MX1]